MNKKTIILGVLLTVAALAVVRAIFFSSMVPPAPPKAANAATVPGATPTPAAGATAEAATAAAGAPSTGAAPAPAAKANVNLAELAKNVKAVDFQYDPAALARNPMAPLVGPQAILAAATEAADGQQAKPADANLLTQQMAVTGIVWDKKFPVAVINNDVVAPGDVLADGIVVQTIESDKVILAVHDQPVTLQLKHLEEQ